MDSDLIQRSPILEYDPATTAIIEPHGPKLSEAAPERGVLCFFQDVLKQLLQAGQLAQIGNLGSEIGLNPVYHMEYAGQRLLVAHPGVGSAMAAAFLDELIACGVKKFIACGGCGVINRQIAVGYPVVLTAAVRDEGPSYHYLPPAREVQPTAAAVAALEQACVKTGLPYRLGKTWTTDGFYRETIDRRARREAEGCLVVEMEAAAFFAVAEFRKVTFGQVVYGGDLVVPEGWDQRAWQDRTDDRTRMFWLAADAVCLL
jgi:uridine phosphorylase